MRLYNTLTRQIEEIVPYQGKKIGLYACGLTVYDYTHLGHLRKYTLDDVLIKTLRHAGFEVNFVQNVTDVGHLSSDADTGEDKLEKGAKKYGQSVWDIARKFEDYFFYSMDLMHNVRPDVSCRATEHIPAQLEMVKTLEAKGFAYVIPDDGVYFDTSKVADYGKLAHLKLDEQQEGARVEKVAGKRNPSDFALWKFEREGENRAMSWESPWAEKSFPGWHIECSAMSMQYLGEQFEIHTGGIDHIPVHHTNEIAQAEAATGKKPFVKYWVHHNFLRINDEKMSKSLGNFFTIDDVIKKGFAPQALRILFLSAHYRSEMNFTWEALAGAQKAWEKLERILQATASIDASETASPLSDAAEKIKTAFFAALENDLQTAEAMSIVWQVTKDESLADGERRKLLLAFDEVLSLGLAEVAAQTITTQLPTADVPQAVQALLSQRQQARDNKDWATADLYRDKLEKLGYLVTDSAVGQQLVPKKLEITESE